MRLRLDDPVVCARHRWRLRFVSADAMAAALALDRAHGAVTDRLEALLRPFDLNVVRYEVLGLLDFADETALLLGQISEWLDVHPTRVTTNVDRLEAQGYVRRRQHPSDRRAVLVELTSSGEEVFGQASSQLIEAGFGLAALSKKEMVQLERLLARLLGPGPERGPAHSSGRKQPGRSGGIKTPPSSSRA
ncbi:MAG: MarR family winged helix-turn-helix transcriptional regulator [Acidimicrobiia bacterium]